MLLSWTPKRPKYSARERAPTPGTVAAGEKFEPLLEKYLTAKFEWARLSRAAHAEATAKFGDDYHSDGWAKPLARTSPGPTEPDVRVKRILSLIQEVLDASPQPSGWQTMGSIQQSSVSVSFNFHFSNDRFQPHQPKREVFDPAIDRTEAKLTPDEAATHQETPPKSAALPQAAVADALERDFASRYEHALQRRTGRFGNQTCRRVETENSHRFPERRFFTTVFLMMH